MELTGKIIKVLPMQSGQGKNGEWKKQEFIIETDETYPKKVCIAAMNKVAEIVFEVGKIVKCHINIESREYNEKWYTSINVWKVDQQSIFHGPQTLPNDNGDEASIINTTIEQPETGDLPF